MRNTTKTEMDEKRLGRIIKKVDAEFRNASSRNDAFNSAHEGHSVLREEVEELWDEVKKKRRMQDKKNMRLEAVQVAAMAIRFYYDLL